MRKKVRNYAIKTMRITAVVKLPRKDAFEWTCDIEQIVQGRFKASYGDAKVYAGQYNSIDAAIRGAMRADLLAGAAADEAVSLAAVAEAA